MLSGYVHFEDLIISDRIQQADRELNRYEELYSVLDYVFERRKERDRDRMQNSLKQSMVTGMRRESDMGKRDDRIQSKI